MILTQQTVSRLLSNHTVVQSLPELLPYIEQMRAARVTVEQAPGCKTCRDRSAVEPTLRQALQFIRGLAPDRLEVLKTFLGGGRLYTYVPQSDGKQGLVELGV
jgi:hypothetical protein